MQNAEQNATAGDIARLARTKKIAAAASEIYDIAVIGGGIHGACIARDAALRGYRVLLLEKNDYAFGTSSRSSKLIHGGVRYLEQGDIRLVAEALGERDILLRAAPHIVRSTRWYFPVVPGATRPAWQIQAGLKLYDIAAKCSRSARSSGHSTSSFPASRRLDLASQEAAALKSLGLKFSGLFEYSDGQMEDTRLVMENIVDSVQLGAVTLNYAAVTSFKRLPSADAAAANWLINWDDRVAKQRIESRARYLVNAAGPSVKQIHESSSSWPAKYPAPRYSRGVHLLFDCRLPVECLILPTGTPGRYYFVLPYFSPFGRGTLVGTTDRETPANEENPHAAPDEIDELLAFLRRDLPEARLERDRLFHVFCGTRVLVPNRSSLFFRPSNASSVSISRRELLLEEKDYLAIVGGKYTTARAVAEHAVNRIDSRLRRGKTAAADSTRSRPFPGGRFSSAAEQTAVQNGLADYLQAAYPSLAASAAHELAAVSVSRLGSRASLLMTLNCGQPDSHLPASYFAAEAAFSLQEEQAVYAEDIVQRRLCLWAVPGDMESEIAALAARFKLEKSAK